MKYIDGKTPQPTEATTAILFDKTGEMISDDEKFKVPHFAKRVTLNEAANATYYVMTHQSSLFDPNGPYGRRERVLDTKLKRVTKNTFDFYLTYLKTNNTIYFTKAQRGFLND